MYRGVREMKVTVMLTNYMKVEVESEKVRDINGWIVLEKDGQMYQIAKKKIAYICTVEELEK